MKNVTAERYFREVKKAGKELTPANAPLTVTALAIVGAFATPVALIEGGARLALKDKSNSGAPVEETASAEPEEVAAGDEDDDDYEKA